MKRNQHKSAKTEGQRKRQQRRRGATPEPGPGAKQINAERLLQKTTMVSMLDPIEPGSRLSAVRMRLAGNMVANVTIAIKCLRQRWLRILKWERDPKSPIDPQMRQCAVQVLERQVREENKILRRLASMYVKIVRDAEPAELASFYAGFNQCRRDNKTRRLPRIHRWWRKKFRAPSALKLYEWEYPALREWLKEQLRGGPKNPLAKKPRKRSAHVRRPAPQGKTAHDARRQDLGGGAP